MFCSLSSTDGDIAAASEVMLVFFTADVDVVGAADIDAMYVLPVLSLVSQLCLCCVLCVLLRSEPSSFTLVVDDDCVLLGRVCGVCLCRDCSTYSQLGMNRGLWSQVIGGLLFGTFFEGFVSG